MDSMNIPRFIDCWFGERLCMQGGAMNALTVQEWTHAAIELVKASHRHEIRRLERLLMCTQAEAVTHFVEHSRWAADLPGFSHGRGTDEERRKALLALWWAEAVSASSAA
jgi:hypothetical protein